MGSHWQAESLKSVSCSSELCSRRATWKKIVLTRRGTTIERRLGYYVLIYSFFVLCVCMHASVAAVAGCGVSRCQVQVSPSQCGEAKLGKGG
jgi:hypothetical protein